MSRFYLAGLCLCCATHSLLGQTNFSEVDAYAAQFHIVHNDIEQLTDTLTAPYATDTEKARAIFTWIGLNIDYDCGSENRLPAEPESAIDPLYYTQVQLQNILRTRRTRCEGYAFLFKLMCNLAGIYCTQMEGYARFRGERVDPATVRPNHAWNAACLDGEWSEIDVSAGSGSCDGRRFRRERRDEHFRMSAGLLEKIYIPVYDGRRSSNQGWLILKF